MNRTAQIMTLLDLNGPMSSGEIARATAMPTRHVWGLLKGPIQRGAVMRADRLFSLNRDADRGAVLSAIRLLRRNGFFVSRRQPTNSRTIDLCDCEQDPSDDEWTARHCNTCGKDLDP